MGSSVSVSNALSSNMLGSSSRMSNIYDIYIYIYIYCPGEFNTYFIIMEVIAHRQPAFLALLPHHLP